MVNSGSFDSADGNRNGKSRCGTQQVGDAALGSQSSDEADNNKNSTLLEPTADGDLPGHAIEPTPTKTPEENEFSGEEKVEVLEEKPTTKQTTRKLLCLYCDRTFVSVNLRQKHVERVHSVKPNRRVSARRQNQQLCTTPCSHCDKLNTAEHTLSDLFQHLVQEHSGKYYGCISCEERFLNSFYLSEHNRNNHFMEISNSPNLLETNDNVEDTLKGSITRSKLRSRPEEPSPTEVTNLPNNKKKKKSKLKDLRNKKISIKTSKIAIKRSTRLQQQTKDLDLNKKRKTTNPKPETSDKSKTSSVNPYPEFDSFYRVKKITDHSIDNLKISSLTFDDVFDKAFFNRIKCNIEENLLHHIDGKLFKNEESESRISNFEKIPTAAQEIQNQQDNYGCEMSLNAITPASALSLNSQFGEDFESQIEYGSKPSKKKPQIKSDEVHYKYFTRRKYQASILQQKENRDLSKLDMWTQVLVKERQEKVLDKKKSSKELQEYTSGQEYKSKIRREELNRILDRRGPFEDLKEEATKKAAFDKLNSSSDGDISQEVFTDVREVLNDLLNRVFEAVKEEDKPLEVHSKEIDKREIPAFLNLRRKTSLTQEEMDKSDKIALICSSQETENFELPTNAVRGKNEKIELTGEWARSRMYICAACGGKFSNMKYLLDHKSLYHQNVWVQHYEFVGNQSELYRHLSIPNLGKVGFVEETIPCKQLWKRSEARLCTKCGKRCNSLGELHRHVLECGGDWTWMLARKKLKYKPMGGKSRRKRKVFTGFEPKNPNRIKKTETTEKKTLKKPMDGPRQRPSDADTIQRMLANLPAKRMRRNIMSLSDVVFKSKKTNNTQKLPPITQVQRGNKSQTDKTKSNPSRALRSFGKVLSSRILDINSSIMVKRKIKVLRSQRLTRNSNNDSEKELIDTEEPQEEESKKVKTPKKEALENTKKSIGKRILTSRLNMKNFFPVKKRNRSLSKNLEKIPESEDKKANYLENFDQMKKTKRGGLKGFVRALSLRKRNSKDEESAATTETKIGNKSIEAPKKRKLQQTFRKVINKVKKIKTNKSTTENQAADAFLEKALEQDSAPREIKEDKEDLVPTVTSLIDSENPPIPETIFNLSEKEEKGLQAKGQLDFDVNKTPVTIDIPIKPKSVPLLSPNIKGKIRKPSRGLNDCIAMLTTKLKQKDDKLSLSRESLFSTSSTTSVEPHATSLETFQTPILPTITVNESPIIETALDLSKKSLSNSQDNELLSSAWTSVDDIIQKVIEENTTTNNRSNLDDTIDSVVNTSLDWFEIRNKPHKKPRKKRHSNEDLITNILFGKDKLIIAPSSNPNEDDPLIARIKENELKMANAQNSLILPGLVVNPLPFLPIFQPEVLLKEFNETQKELVEEKPLVVEVESTKKPRKGRKPKSETNLDDFNEVPNNEPETVTLPVIELPTENEPTILETKTITKPASDSEDEVPLAQIAKQEETVNEAPTKNDMVETLTTDSLKENIETPKQPNLIDTQVPTTTKKIRKKKRKKIFVRQKRHLLNKPSVKLDALLESNTNLPEDLTKSPQQGEEIVDKEVPTKISSSQRTRRKSKSSKKIDTVDNDLFKNFSLVINKKTKRIPPTSIVDDSVCDDINFFVKPLAEAKPDSSSENLLNDSVEEMDMELEDLPVNSSIIIIERDASLLEEAYKSVTVCNDSGEKIEESGSNAEEMVEVSEAKIPDVVSSTEAVQDLSIIESVVEAATPKKRGRPPKNQNKDDKVFAKERPLNQSTPKRGRPRRSKNVTPNTCLVEETSGTTQINLEPNLPVIPVNQLPQISNDVEEKECPQIYSEESVIDVKSDEVNEVEVVAEKIQESINENKEDLFDSNSEIDLVPKRGTKKGVKNKKCILIKPIENELSATTNKDEESFIDSPVKRRRGRPSKNQAKTKSEIEVVEQIETEVAGLPLNEALEDKTDHIDDNDISELPLSSNDIDEEGKSRRSRKIIDYNEEMLEKKALEITPFVSKGKKSRKNVDEALMDNCESFELLPIAKTVWEDAIICNVSEFSEVPKLVVDIHHKDQIEIEVDKNIISEEASNNDVYNFEDTIVVTKKAEKKKRRSRKSTNTEEPSAINDPNNSLVEDLVTLEQKLEALENESYSRYQKKPSKNNEVIIADEILSDEISKNLEFADEPQILNNNKSVDLLDTKDVFEFEESTNRILNNNKCAVIELESESILKPKKGRGKTKRNKKNQNKSVLESIEDEPVELKLEPTLIVQKNKGKKFRKNKRVESEVKLTPDQEIAIEAQQIDSLIPIEDVIDDTEAAPIENGKIADKLDEEMASEAKFDDTIIEAQNDDFSKNQEEAVSDSKEDEDLNISEAGNGENCQVNVDEQETNLPMAEIVEISEDFDEINEENGLKDKSRKKLKKNNMDIDVINILDSSPRMRKSRNNINEDFVDENPEEIANFSNTNHLQENVPDVKSIAAEKLIPDENLLEEIILETKSLPALIKHKKRKTNIDEDHQQELAKINIKNLLLSSLAPPDSSYERDFSESKIRKPKKSDNIFRESSFDALKNVLDTENMFSEMPPLSEIISSSEMDIAPVLDEIDKSLESEDIYDFKDDSAHRKSLKKKLKNKSAKKPEVKSRKRSKSNGNNEQELLTIEKEVADILNVDNKEDQDGLELRRSRRESRKVASYNENDLIDPLIDALEKTRSRAPRKDKPIEIEKPKLSSEELFDLLKKSSCDTEVTNANAEFFGQLDSSNGADQDLPSDVDSIQDPNKIYEFTDDSPENTLLPKKKKSLPENNEENNYCEICKKSFIRIENLIKHKSTLTHISKLSELEAKEAEEKARLKKLAEEEEQILVPTVIQEDKPLPLQNHHSLKLVDIISDVLNKPVLENYHEPKECDVKRYKSLGERKSFDSEVNNPPYILPTTILEKQINLLENIIGNNLNNKQPENNYIDEISSCSNTSENSCATIFNVNSDADFMKPPMQYEEISEDSVNRAYEDPKQRKTLNRDEELFLECCSLLKSGSEVSNSVKNPANGKNLIQPVEEAHEFSDNSRTPTPLGDTFDDDASNSNTISSNWHLNSEKTVDKNPSLSFEEVKNKEAAGMSFGEILTKGLKNQFENVAKINERVKEDHCQEDPAPEQPSAPEDRKDDSDGSIAGKKVATKGARKVYEGLRVSIPTEDLNLDVLNANKYKTPNVEEQTSPSKPRSTRKSKPVKKSQIGSNLLFKVNKKRPIQADVYNFEDTQDNADIFIKPSSKDINKKNTAIIASDNESLGYADSIGADAKSVSSLSSISAMSTKKPPEPTTPDENITKNKSKIMGKIFKNAAKTKTEEIDEELRHIPEIPEIDNLELVENYVRNCQRVQSPFLPPPPPPAPLDQAAKKPKMTEEEMNLLFDQLLGKEIEPKVTKKDSSSKRKNHNGNKVKHRKKARVNSESSDEYNINKSVKKRSNKKNNQNDSGINMELELKECIGVASRKSQRTCTSGKQNILVEYWSSDEEAFEAMLETHKLINEEVFQKPLKPKKLVKKPRKPKSAPKTPQEIAVATSNRRKRAAANPLYHWSSSSEDESQSLIEIKPIREEEDEDDRPVQHGWIVGDSPKKLVTMLALTKGKKTDFDSVKEQGKRRTSNIAS